MVAERPLTKEELQAVIDDLGTIMVRWRQTFPDAETMMLRVPRSMFNRCMRSKLNLVQAVDEVAAAGGFKCKLVIVG
jgi:hypothetical protein